MSKRILKGVAAVIDIYGEIHKVNEEAEVAIGKERGEKVVSNGLFGKVWIGSGIEKLGSMEIVFLVRIMGYIRYEDNTIRDGEEVMSVKEMAAATGLGYARLSEAIKGMCRDRVMGKHDTREIEYRGRRKVVYSVNPYVVCRGRVVNRKICDYFLG